MAKTGDFIIFVLLVGAFVGMLYELKQIRPYFDSILT